MATLKEITGITSRLPILKKILIYGVIGVASEIVLYAFIGFTTRNPVLIAVGVLFWIVFSGVMAWVMWELVIPMAGRDKFNDR